MAKTRKLTLYLVKAGVPLSDVLRKEKTHSLTRVELKPELEIEGTIWIERRPPAQPDWARYVQTGAATDLPQILSSGGSAVTIIKVEGRSFVFTFGHSQSWIDKTKIERQFGLRVVLNCVERDKIKSVDSEEVEVITRSRRSQTSTHSSIDQFGLDVARDLLRCATGIPEDKSFASSVTGADSLCIQTDAKFDQLASKCAKALTLFNSVAYREKGFAWVDNFVRVTDDEIVAALDSSLIEAINNPNHCSIFLTAPTIIDFPQQYGFRFPRERRGFRPDIRLGDYLETKRRAQITLADLRRDKIRHYTTSDTHAGEEYTVYECVLFERRIGNKLHVLTRGEWFFVDKDYVDRIDGEVANIPIFNRLLPEAHRGEAEGAYNKRVATIDSTYHCLDTDLVSYGRGYSSIEVCDLLTKDGNFIHVKSGTKSSRLSHLFAQGLNAAQMMTDPTFRSLTAQKCPFGYASLFGADYDPRRCSVVYAIITDASDELHEALPFFSKQSLANAVRHLKSYGYPVFLQKIRYSSLNSVEVAEVDALVAEVLDEIAA